MLEDIRFALRGCGRDRAFTATAVLVLALGIGVNSVMFTILEAHTIRGLPLDRVDRVLYVSTRDERDLDRGVSWLEFDEMRRAASGIALAAFVSSPAGLSLPDAAPERIERAFVTADTFMVLGVQPMFGRTFRLEDDLPGAPSAVVLAESAWRRTFASDRSALGRTVLIDGEPSVVIGVLRDGAGFPGAATVWQPLGQLAGLERSSPASRVLRVVGRVRDGSTPNQAAAELRSIAERWAEEHPDTNRGIRADVVPVNERLLGRPGDPAWAAFMAVGFLVLFVAAANVAHLMIGRGLQRARETAVQSSLGASRIRIVRQILLEAALLATGGGVAGAALAVIGVRAFERGIPQGTLPYWMAYTLDARVLAALVMVSALTAILAGMVPALQAAGADPIVALKAGGSITAGVTERRWTGAFLVAQLAISVVMIANVALGLRVARVELPSDTALRDSRVITATVSLPASRYPDAEARLAFHAAVRQALAATAGVLNASAASALPARPIPERQLLVRGREHETPVAVRQVAVGTGYFETIKTPIVAGRSFTDADGGPGRATVLLNERLTRLLFAGAEPLGQHVAFVAPDGTAPPDWLEVVGIAPVIRQGNQAEPEPIAYVPLHSTAPAIASLLVRSSVSSATMVAELRERVRRIDPGLPLFDVGTLRDSVADASWNGRLSMRLIVALTAIAVGLAAAGLFAVVNRRVLGQRREIGIRIVLGASPAGVGRLVVGAALRQVVLGAGFGVAAVIAWDAVFAPAARSAAVLPGARLADPTVLLTIGVALATVALLACLGPILRAQAVDPVAILRQE
jgi:predicted permease